MSLLRVSVMVLCCTVLHTTIASTAASTSDVSVVLRPDAAAAAVSPEPRWWTSDSDSGPADQDDAAAAAAAVLLSGSDTASVETGSSRPVNNSVFSVVGYAEEVVVPSLDSDRLDDHQPDHNTQTYRAAPVGAGSHYDSVKPSVSWDIHQLEASSSLSSASSVAAAAAAVAGRRQSSNDGDHYDDAVLPNLAGGCRAGDSCDFATSTIPGAVVSDEEDVAGMVVVTDTAPAVVKCGYKPDGSWDSTCPFPAGAHVGVVTVQRKRRGVRRTAGATQSASTVPQPPPNHHRQPAPGSGPPALGLSEQLGRYLWSLMDLESFVWAVWIGSVGMLTIICYLGFSWAFFLAT